MARCNATTQLTVDVNIVWIDDILNTYFSRYGLRTFVNAARSRYVRVLVDDARRYVFARSVDHARRWIFQSFADRRDFTIL